MDRSILDNSSSHGNKLKKYSSFGNNGDGCLGIGPFGKQNVERDAIRQALDEFADGKDTYPAASCCENDLDSR